jgi:hypothetical protein
MSGTGTGKTTLVSPGVYHLTGSFTDPTNGISGKYEGDLYNTGDYSQCAGGSFQGCVTDPVTHTLRGTCNLVTGNIRLHWGPQSISLQFGSPGSHFAPSVCLHLDDPTVHDLRLGVFNTSPPQFPSHKLGQVDWADGFIDGVSSPSNGDGSYADSFTFRLDYGVFTNS